MELSNEKDIPSQNIATLGWVDDRSFIYTDGRNIFKYNIDELKSDFLYKTASNEIVEYLYVKNNKIYISINLGDGIGYISRLIINDKNQYQKINNVLPYATKHCYFTYNNFNKPTIIINNSNNSCIEDLKVNLKSNNIDIGKYIVKYDPSS